MSQAQAVPLNPAQAIKPGHVEIRGRIAYRRKSKDGKTVMTLITMPAPDSYSHPATVEVVSDASIGAKDDEVRVVCRLGGNRRNFQGHNADDEPITIYTADNRLYVVE